MAQSKFFPCPSCRAPTAVDTSSRHRTFRRGLAVWRTRRCRACGFEGITAEFWLDDMPRAAAQLVPRRTVAAPPREHLRLTEAARGLTIAEAAEAFYRVVDAAYERRSVAVTSNLHPSGFDTFMPKTLATAAVDRLLHHAHVGLTEGASYRLAEATTGKGWCRSPDRAARRSAGRRDGDQVSTEMGVS